MVTELDACALHGALIDVFNVCAELMALRIRITVSWWEQLASLVTKHWKRGKMADVALNLLLNLFLPLPQLRGLLQVIMFLLHLYWYAKKIILEKLITMLYSRETGRVDHCHVTGKGCSYCCLVFPPPPSPPLRNLCHGSVFSFCFSTLFGYCFESKGHCSSWLDRLLVVSEKCKMKLLSCHQMCIFLHAMLWKRHLFCDKEIMFRHVAAS